MASKWLDFGNRLIRPARGDQIIGPRPSTDGKFFLEYRPCSIDYNGATWDLPTREEAQKAYDKVRAQLITNSPASYYYRGLPVSEEDVKKALEQFYQKKAI